MCVYAYLVLCKKFSFLIPQSAKCSFSTFSYNRFWGLIKKTLQNSEKDLYLETQISLSSPLGIEGAWLHSQSFDFPSLMRLMKCLLFISEESILFSGWFQTNVSQVFCKSLYLRHGLWICREVWILVLPFTSSEIRAHHKCLRKSGRCQIKCLDCNLKLILNYFNWGSDTSRFAF